MMFHAIYDIIIHWNIGMKENHNGEKNINKEKCQRKNRVRESNDLLMK